MFCLRVWAVALLCVLLRAPRVGAIGPRSVENGHLGLGVPNASAKLVEASSYVLPNVSAPVSYELFVDLSDESFQTYSGTVDITFQQTATGKSLALNSVGLIVNETTLRVTQSTGNAILIERFENVPESQMIVLHCSESLVPGEVYRAHLEFAGSINIDFFKGLYRSSYRTENGVKYLATTFFAAIYARTAFPCYDEPAYKATFGVKIRHHDKHTALSNMPAIDSVPSGEFVDTSFQTTPIMSTYLVAFVVSELKTLPTQDGLFRVFAPEGREHLTQYAHDFAFRALRYLENFFGRQNQMAKIDLVAIPDFAMGAMENWGLITFREDYLLHEQGVSTARSEQFVGAIVTHELAHMWFGNEVTPEWWTYVWLNEGFARYFENYITSQLEPSWNLWDQFVVVNVHSALSLDCHSNNRAMSYYTTDPSVLNELYDYVVYAKSASVIRMIQNVIGIGSFRMAINDYLRSRSYLTTAPQYLYTSIEKFRTVDLPASVEEIFEGWANSPGYPLVTVTIDWSGRTLMATQKRFWMPIEDESPPPNQLFFVPLNYASNLASSEDVESTDAIF
ncbi:puromycin-sensitive aminopeptidase-like protein, partial [Anopheles cruzii]|uniref:puromycin-sensitive aminopeptidase-like protein n=1 Tax=Anopheles cruzii TaxID=68878 RepID=UPI0022EC795C